MGLYTYIHIYIYVYTHKYMLPTMYIYIYIYICGFGEYTSDGESGKLSGNCMYAGVSGKCR